MATLGSLIVKIGADLEPLKKGLNGASKLTGNAVKTIGKGFALGAAGGVTLLGAGIGKVGIEAFSTANDIDTATKQIQSALGVTAEQAEQLGQIGVDVFKNNFTGSIGEATAAVGLTAQQLKSIEFDELGMATQNALRLADAFDTDINSTLNAANVLMSQFGLTQQQSFDFLSSGFQKGLDTSGDFLESVTEYGNLFGQAGADAGQFFSVMESGLQGGVLGTDRAADLFKEFSIRIQEGTDSQIQALSALGIDSDMLFSGLSDGSISVIDAFTGVQQALTQVSDPLAQQAIGVELMGTQFEDLGATAATAIDTAATSLDDLQGSTETLDAQYDTLTAKFETIGRKAQTALAPIGDVLLEQLELAIPSIEKLVNFLVETGVPAITQAFDAMKLGFAFFEQNDTFERISSSFVRIGEALGLIPEGSEASSLALDGFMALLGTFETGVQAGVLVIEGIATGMEAIATATESAVDFFGKLGEALAGLKVPEALQGMIDKFTDLKASIPDWLIPGSPPPLFWALKDINTALKEAPDLSTSYGFGNAPALSGALNGNAEASGGPGQAPTVINVVLDGQIIETIVSGRQGIRRQNRAALGGATAL